MVLFKLSLKYFLIHFFTLVFKSHRKGSIVKVNSQNIGGFSTLWVFITVIFSVKKIGTGILQHIS